MKMEKFRIRKLQVLQYFTEEASDLLVEIRHRFLCNIENNKLFFIIGIFTCIAGEVNKLEIRGQKKILAGYQDAKANLRSQWLLWFIKVHLSLCSIN
jgi:hypothetical protein